MVTLVYNFISMKSLSLIITLAITAGQLIKVPVGNGGGATIIDLAIIVLCLLGLFRIRLRLITPPPFIIAGLLFIIIALLSLIFTPLNLTINQYIFSFLYTVRFTSYILLCWLLLSKSLPFLKQDISQILLLSGVSLAILGLLQFIFFPNLQLLTILGWDPHYYRTVSTFLDPNFTGAFFVLTLLLICQKKSFIRKFRCSILILVFLALLTTFSRSSYLMFLISFITYSLIKKSIKLFTISFIAFLVLMGSFYVYTQVISKPRGVDRAKSASFRLDTWQQGFVIFQRNPILGVGFNAYKFALGRYGLTDEELFSSRGSTSNDSSLLFVLSTTGLVGFVFYLYFLFSPFFLKNKDVLLISALSGLIVHSFFSNSLFYPFILIWVILVLSQSSLK